MDPMYKKRAGTSGISGQLYETKLISLILFRLLHDDSIEEFYLASNMDDIGTFDDICIKIKMKGLDRPILMLIQAKHKENDDKFLTFHNRNDLVKWSNSIMNTKQQFSSNKKQKLFGGKFDETECLFILYTNAKYDVDPSYKYESSFAYNLNKLIATGAAGYRPLNTERDVQDMGATILNEEMAMLAERFAKYLNDKPDQSMNIMNDEYLLRYHVILVKYVVNVSEIQSEEQTPDLKWRFLTFKQDFFNTNDKYLTLFKNQLYGELIENHTRTKDREVKDKIIRDSSTSETTVEEQISTFLSNPSAITLSSLIETHITYKLGQLRFISRRPQSELQQLEQINIPPFAVDQAKAMVAKEILSTVKIKVPVAFGNVDVTIRGSQRKIERRLNHLMDIIVELSKKSEQDGPFKVIKIDETVDDGVLSSNGGLGGAVGNVLVNDENTNLLKFSDNDALLQNNARTLLLKINNKINNLHEYRFKVRTINFPKLSLDCTDVAIEFLNKLVIYANQSNHYEVEEILKNEIQDHHSADLHNFPIKTNSIFVNYHNEIQKWWMTSITAPYITKTNNIYQRSINNIIEEPQITALQNIFHMNNLKSIKYTFIEEATKMLETQIEQNSSNVIVTDIPTLTTIKVIQCIRLRSNNKYAVLDLECILNLPIEDFKALNIEMGNTEKILLVMCNNTTYSRHLHKRLDALSQAIEKKKKIVITNKVFVETIKEYFPELNELNDEGQTFIDLTTESQIEVIKNTQVIFQGEDVSLDLLVDDVSVAFIKGAVLNKIVTNEPLIIGTSLSDENYEEIKNLYVDRRVSRNPYKYFEYDDYYSEEDYEEYVPSYLITTFEDISESVVLIVAKPGMGKSTLLTHLSLRTKVQDKTLWIVRINLLEHSKQFNKWQKNKMVIDTLETLKFMCQIGQRNNNITINLEEIDSKVYLKDGTGDEWAIFELKMFLHFYNKSKLIFIFDGFDEICPHYKDDVIKFLDVVRNYQQENKLWVTSRPYSDILPDLERILGTAYGIEYINTAEQDLYLTKLFQTNLKFETISKVQLNNIKSFVNFMLKRKQSMKAGDTLLNQFSRVFYKFYAYIYSHFEFDLDETIGKTKPAAQCDVGRRDKFMGTPLLLYLFADYFINLICDSENINRWERTISTITIYEMFIETKLKKVLFQDKNKMDVYNPDIIVKYEKERADCIALHKKIAAYYLLGNPIYSYVLDFDEFKGMRPFSEEDEYVAAINAIKSGTEKTGLISHVVPDTIPIFIHKTFEEYFAAEFICDIFKSDKFAIASKRLLYTVLSCYNHYKLFDWVRGKREIDAVLNCVLNDIESTRPTLSTWYNVLFQSENWSSEQFARLMSSSPEDYYSDCFSKYNYRYFMVYLNTSEPQRSIQIFQIREDIIANMKPKFKEYFTNPR